MGRQLTWVLEHSGPDAVGTVDVEEHFAPSFLKAIVAPQVVTFLGQLGPLRSSTVHELNAEEHALHGVLIIDEERVHVVAQVEPDPPYRIVQLGFRSGPSLLQVLDDVTPAAGSESDAVAERFVPLTDEHQVGGIVVAVISSGDEERWSFGGAPPEGIYEIGSITKAVTGILLAEMVSRGEVALGDPVAKYLPDGVIVPRESERAITLLDLATHTSGLPRLPPGFEPSDMSNPYADFTVDRLYDALGRAELLFSPGERAEYSNFAFGLLGHVVGLVVGRSYAELIAERICAPLELHETFLEVPPDRRKHRVRGHGQSGEPVPHWDPGAILGAGGIEASIRDLSHFLKANLDPAGTPIGEALEMAQQPRFGRVDRHRMGLGWSVLDTSDGSAVVWKNGGTGGFRSSCAFHRASGTGVAALCNSSAIDLDAAVVGTLAAIASKEGSE